jgi:hypothetical protein
MICVRSVFTVDAHARLHRLGLAGALSGSFLFRAAPGLITIKHLPG